MLIALDELHPEGGAGAAGEHVLPERGGGSEAEGMAVVLADEDEVGIAARGEERGPISGAVVLREDGDGAGGGGGDEGGGDDRFAGRCGYRVAAREERCGESGENDGAGCWEVWIHARSVPNGGKADGARWVAGTGGSVSRGARRTGLKLGGAGYELDDSYYAGLPRRAAAESICTHSLINVAT